MGDRYDGTGGAGYDVMGGREWGNAKAQGRNEKEGGFPPTRE